MIKISIRELKKNLPVNLLITIQMIVVFVLIICMSSIFSYFYKYYRVFAKYLSGDGCMIISTSHFIDSEGYLINDTSELEANMVDATVIGYYDIVCDLYDSNMKNRNGKFIGYDEDFLDDYVPELAEGKWLSKNMESTDYIEAVITANTYGIKTGDTVYLKVYGEVDEDIYMPVKIRGVLEDGAKVIGYATSYEFTQKSDYRDMYHDYYIEDEGSPMLLLSRENILEYLSAIGGDYVDTVQGSIGVATLISYPDSLSEADKTKNEDYISSLQGKDSKIKMSEVKENSYDTIRNRMLSLIPIFIGAFLLTIFSMICSFTITIKQQMKDYAIYGICGMPWKKSAWISIFTAGVMSVLSLILGVILTWILTTRGIITFTTIQVGVIPVLSCLALIIIYIGIAAILPNALLNGISLNDVMRNNE